MIGDRLKKLRKEKKLTQEDLGKYLNIAASSYSRYETGEREPDALTINLLCQYFHVTSDYLLGVSDEPTINKKHPSFPIYTEGRGGVEKMRKDLSQIIENLSQNSDIETLENYKRLLEFTDNLAEMYDTILSDD